MRSEHGTFRLHRHVRAVAVPTHVALQHLHDFVVGFVGAHAAVRAHVAEGREAEFERAESFRERHLFVVGEMLAGKTSRPYCNHSWYSRENAASSMSASVRPVTVAPNVASSGVTRNDSTWLMCTSSARPAS